MSQYSSNRHLYIGFHGCEKSLAKELLNRRRDMEPSQNSYDWLGKGCYFLENVDLLKVTYESFVKELFEIGKVRPNKVPSGAITDDLLLRFLDCAVIESLHEFNAENGKEEYD